MELICDCSLYFHEVFKNRFTQRRTEPVLLSDADPDTFAEFLAWAYCGEVFKGQSSVAWIQLCRLWVLADKLGAPKLQNLVIEHCNKRYDLDSGLVDRSAVEFVYNNTLPGSPLRRLVVDIWLQRLKKDHFDFVKKDLPRLFLEDLCSEWIERNESSGKGQNPLREREFKNHYFVTGATYSYFRNLAESLPSISDGDLPKSATQEKLANREILRPRSRRRLGGTTPINMSTLSTALTSIDGSELKDEIL